MTDQRIEIATKHPFAKDDSAIPRLIQALSKRHIPTLEGAAPAHIAEVGAAIEAIIVWQ